jgi:hypothetical protein
VALEAAPEAAVGEELLVVDRADRAEHGVEKRRGVALGEEEVVVRRVLRVGEVEPQVPRDQDG